MKLVLALFLVCIISRIYSQADEATNNDIQVDSNNNSTNEDAKNDTKKVNNTRTAKNYSNITLL
jgi:hypothetical protein